MQKVKFRKTLNTTVPERGVARGRHDTQKQGHAMETFAKETMVRPPLPIDINNLPNVEPIQGKQMPRHINFMFAADRQSFEGTLAYGPLGAKRPGRITKDTKNIIHRLGAKSVLGKGE